MDRAINFANYDESFGSDKFVDYINDDLELGSLWRHHCEVGMGLRCWWQKNDYKGIVSLCSGDYFGEIEIYIETDQYE